jgi:hypothetical protein
MAQLPVAHAENILPDMGTFGHVTDVTSGHVTSGHVTSGHVSSGSTTAQHHRNCDLPDFMTKIGKKAAQDFFAQFRKLLIE